MGRNVSTHLKKKVAADSLWKCAICETIVDEYYEIDHIIPLYKNGSNCIQNLQLLCNNCHKRKTYTEAIQREESFSIATCNLCNRTYSKYFKHKHIYSTRPN